MKIKLMMLLYMSLGMLTQTWAQKVTIVTSDELKKGEVIDHALFKVEYKMTMVEDTLANKPPLTETMILDVGNTTSLYYSYTQHISDSVLREDVRKNVSQEELRKHATQFGSGKISYRIYKNYPAGKVTTLDKIGISKFRCEEENEQPQWTLLPDTATILSYLCHKAGCHFKGRNYEAWYTMELPRSEGPWKLFGLPGLIIKAQDSQNYFLFECTGVEQCRNKPEIILSPGMYESITRKALNKVYERYAKDPIGFITSQPGVKVTLTDNSGNEVKGPKNIPYNPIELK